MSRSGLDPAAARPSRRPSRRRHGNGHQAVLCALLTFYLFHSLRRMARRFCPSFIDFPLLSFWALCQQRSPFRSSIDRKCIDQTVVCGCSLFFFFTAGKSLAMSFDCKYIETSSGMQHNVDELLVGILKQIRLKMKVASSGNHPQEGEGCASSARSLFRKRSAGRHHRGHQTTHQTGLTAEDAGNNNRAGGRRSTSLRVRRMLGKVWPNCADYYHNKSKSCEDLHVL